MVSYTYESDRAKSYRAALRRQLASTWGLEDLTQVLIMTNALPDPSERSKVLALESLCWALGEYVAGDILGAFRGYVQCREYIEQAGGFWPAGNAGDASTWLRGEIERALRTVRVAPDAPMLDRTVS